MGTRQIRSRLLVTVTLAFLFAVADVSWGQQNRYGAVPDYEFLEQLSPNDPEAYLDAAFPFLQSKSPKDQQIGIHLVRVAASLLEGERRKEALELLLQLDPDPRRRVAAAAVLVRLYGADVEGVEAALRWHREVLEEAIEQIAKAMKEAAELESLGPLSNVVLVSREEDADPALEEVVRRLLEFSPGLAQALQDWERRAGEELIAAREPADDAPAGAAAADDNQLCPRCDGFGKIKCWSPVGCDGGVVRCRPCRGRGYVVRYTYRTQSVATPFGTAQVPVRVPERVSCRSCGGKGWIQCRLCDGKGVVDCNVCGGKAVRQPVAREGRRKVQRREWRMPPRLKTELQMLAAKLSDAGSTEREYLMGGFEPFPCTLSQYEEILKEPRVFWRDGAWHVRPAP